MADKAYYAVIPADVRYAEIPNGAKLLYGEITALCNEHGYCWAANSYFSNLYDVCNRSIINWINCLEEKGFIEKEIIYKEDSKIVDKRIIRITPVKKISLPSENNFTTPGEKNFTENNTYINKQKSSAKALPEKKPKTSFGELAKEQKEKAEELKARYIIHEFNRVCTNMPKVMKVTPQRINKVKTRLKVFDETDIYKAFDKASCSNFLNGSSGWKANFDWFFENDTNIQKVLEGNYDNSKVKKQTTTIKHNFSQRDYDFKALEKQLLKGPG